VPPADDFAAYQEQLHRGHQALSRGDARAALESYRAAVGLAGDRALPHMLVGRALLALNRPGEALTAFDEALARAADDASALAGRAEALLRLGRRQEAATARARLEQATTATPAAASELLLEGTLPRAEMLVAAGDRALRDERLDTAVEEWLAAARAYAADGHVDAALEVCQRALTVNSGDERVHLELSRLYFAAGLAEHGVERLLLLGRLVELDSPPGLREALAELVQERSAADPRLVELANRIGEPPPA
jgi:tetratricopeptide (TPR) repeat protein